jgi:hypothetical protein
MMFGGFCLRSGAILQIAPVCGVSQARKLAGTPQKRSEWREMDGITYEFLVGVSPKIDAREYRKRYAGAQRNSSGIPLQVEDEVERRARILADTYEQLYDARKQTMREHGVAFSQLARTDDGEPIAINFAAVASIPVFMQALEQGDGPLFLVLVLHWLRASEGKEWVFSHLCEAAYAFRKVSAIRAQIPEIHHEAFEDLQMALEEALYQYNHRHC